MKIGILASPSKKAAWELKNLPATSFSWVQDTNKHTEFDVWIDFDFDENPDRAQEYCSNNHTIFLLGAVFNSIEGILAQQKITIPITSLNSGDNHAAISRWKAIGINNLPTFLERDTLEFTNPFNIDITKLEPIFFLLNYPKWECVNSRVGLVTPRIVCMIINEAYYTVQEKTALPADIDQAMKLGTNYPKGPFQWCNEIGIKNVYLLLEAMYKDTGEERYKICSLLKQEFLQQQIGR